MSEDEDYWGGGYWGGSFWAKSYWSRAIRKLGKFADAIAQMEKTKMSDSIWKTGLWTPGMWEKTKFHEVLEKLK